jgi:pimeloyl-ACP methyl ester carboxylesterase
MPQPNLLQRTILVIASFLVCAGLSTIAFAQESPEIKFVQVGDVKLAYYTRGKGEPLLMVNGFLSTMALWDPALLDELSKNHQLVLFDNRGVGLSTDSKENHTTMPQMADDAAGLAKALGYKKVNILAWSMGARIGQ